MQPSPPPGSAALFLAAAAHSPLRVFDGDLGAALTAAAFLAAAGLFTLLRASLDNSHPARVVEPLRGSGRRQRLERRLAAAGPLAASARLFAVSCELSFAFVLLAWLCGEAPATAGRIAAALAIAVPCIVLFAELLPAAFARRHGDHVLRTALGTFHVVSYPLRSVVFVIDFARRAFERALGLPEDTATARAIVAELREVVADSTKPGGLEDHERELIENVIEFHATDVAAIMTPRTEIQGVDVREGIAGAVRKAAETGFSRIPVYEDSLDTIIGTITARDLVRLAANEGLERADLRSCLHPVYFVPETKRVEDLLREFRRLRPKIAIVLDEYGGTAGLVTAGDVLGEIFGALHEDRGGDDSPAVRMIGEGIAEVDASLHVSEVNAELDLELPEEEDFETLGGFVLSELGHLPKAGESFARDGVTYHIVAASDRRVITVRVERSGRRNSESLAGIPA